MKLSLKSVARFTRQMATYQDSFVDIRRALDSLSRGTPDGRMASSLHRVLARVEDGASLFEAFNAEGNLYPLIFVRMTKVGEESGTLAVIYKQLADYLEQQVAMRKRFVSRLIYPCFMICALVVVHSLLTAVFATIGNTRSTANFAEIEALFLKTLGQDVLIIAIIVGSILFLRALLVGRSVTDALIYFIPPLRGPIRKLVLSRFSLSMYLMTGSAIGLPEAVTESGKATNNAFVASQLEAAAYKIQEGTALTPALEETGLFPRDFIDIVSVAEESGKLSESLRRVSVHYAEDAEVSLNRLVSGIAWGIYAVVGGIMVYYIITLYAGYVNAISQQMNNY